MPTLEVHSRATSVGVGTLASIDRTPVSPDPDRIESNPVEISPHQRTFIEDHGSSLLSEAFYTRMVAKTAERLLPLIRN